MAQDDDALSANKGSPGSKTLTLDQLLGPVTSVPIAADTVYLYALRVSDYSELDKLVTTEPCARFRALLPFITSLVETKGFKEARQPLQPDAVDRLTESDLERLADAYTVALQRCVRVTDHMQDDPPQREPGEAATAYLDRLLTHDVHAHADALRRTREEILASTGGMFDQVRKSTATLGSTLSAFERFTRGTTPITLSEPRIDHFPAMSEQFARQARERAEELEMVHLTGKMTAESAQTLKDLAEAATVLLERLDERDQKTDQSTRKQIKIAVWSVGISAVIAVFALIASLFAYIQDKANNESGDKFQAEVLAIVREVSRQQSAAQQENQLLRAKVSELEGKVARFAASQAITLPVRDAASAAGR